MKMLVNNLEFRNRFQMSGMSKVDFADRLGVTVGAVNHWIFDRREVPEHIMRILRYCDRRGVNLEEFKLLGQSSLPF